MALALEKQYNYYKSHEMEFLQKHPGEIVVISNDLEVSFLDTVHDAYVMGCRAYGLGNFFMQKCVPDPPADKVVLMWERVDKKGEQG